MSDRPEIELLPIRPLESITVARSEFMHSEYDYASPIDGDDRLSHDYRVFVRAGIIAEHWAAQGGKPADHDEVRKP